MQSCLRSCCVAYGLQSVQNASGPLVTGARRRDHITSHRFCGSCTGCSCDNESNLRSLSWSSGVYPAMHRRICQTTVSSSLTSACADSAWPTRRCVSFDGHTTPSTIGVLQRLDHHACPTHYLLNYDNVTVSESSNSCWRHSCSGTTALCDILVKSMVFSYTMVKSAV